MPPGALRTIQHRREDEAHQKVMEHLADPIKLLFPAHRPHLHYCTKRSTTVGDSSRCRGSLIFERGSLRSREPWRNLSRRTPCPLSPRHFRLTRPSCPPTRGPH